MRSPSPQFVHALRIVANLNIVTSEFHIENAAQRK